MRQIIIIEDVEELNLNQQTNYVDSNVTQDVDCCEDIPETTVHNSLSDIQGGTELERYHLTKRIHDALDNDLASDENKFITKAEASSNFKLTYGILEAEDNILTINWINDIIPNEGITYVEKHGPIENIVIQTLTPNPLVTNGFSPSLNWSIILTGTQRVIINNIESKVHYLITSTHYNESESGDNDVFNYTLPFTLQASFDEESDEIPIKYPGDKLYAYEVNQIVAKLDDIEPIEYVEPDNSGNIDM